MLRCPNACHVGIQREGRYRYTLNLSTRVSWVVTFSYWKGSPHNYWIGNWVSPSLSLNCPAFNLVIIPSTLMQVVRKMTRNFSHSSLCCSWYLKWAPFKYMSDAWLHEPTCPTKTLYLARQDDSYDWWLHMFIQHSATGLLAIFQAGSSLEENWLMYGIWYR